MSVENVPCPKREPHPAHLWRSGVFPCPGVGDVDPTLWELADCPISPESLAENEREDYAALEAVLSRHAFFDHDCQTVACEAMFVLNSVEFTQILTRAQERVR